MTRSDDAGFLARWAARKHAVRSHTEVDNSEPSEALKSAVDQGDDDNDELSDDQILEKLGLPAPEGLQAGDDFSGFMANSVPARLRNRALRRLWVTNPILANLDELLEYGEDYTDAATVVENLETAYRVGKGFLRREEIEDLEEGPEAEAADVVDETEDAPLSSAGECIEDAELDQAAVASRHSDEPAQVPNEAAVPDMIEASVPRTRRMTFRQI